MVISIPTIWPHKTAAMSASKVFEKGSPKDDATELADGSVYDVGVGSIDPTAGSQALHRKLRGKEVQMFAIGGAIGTCKDLNPRTHEVTWAFQLSTTRVQFSAYLRNYSKC
jgi:hypothetical protein